MLFFENDYCVPCHEAILQALQQANVGKFSGYGMDDISRRAAQKILQACALPAGQGEVFFLVGGTQTNCTVIDALLHKTEGVLAATTAHIATHEAGAIENSGHKVLTLPSYAGKLKAEDVRSFMQTFLNDESRDHMVQPGMVYISQPTEYGSLYSKKELEAISAVCREYELPLYVDGARLGYALMSQCNDVSLPELASLCDVFYIGGTKVGALFGEAVVFTRKAPRFFFTQVKQHGALLAKGFVTGVQFDTLFTDDLYFKISANAIRQTGKIVQALQNKGYTMYQKPETNQLFVLMPVQKYEAAFKGKIAVSEWEYPDAEHIVVRIVTHFATTDADVAALIAAL